MDQQIVANALFHQPSCQQTLPPESLGHRWAEIMRRWLKNTHPGEILPVGPELGSAPYSIHDPEGREFSNRWEQALVMKKLTELTFQKVQKSQT